MSDLDEDPATVKADRRAITRALESLDEDPATVQRFVSGRPGMPMSLPGESVSDPETVFDDGGDASRWHDDVEPHAPDELPPGPLPSAWSAGPAWTERSGPTLAREIPLSGWGTVPRRAEELPAEPTNSRVTVWVPILVGASGGFLFLLLIVAWFLGSP